MAGRKIIRRDYKKLNKVGEDRIFDSYVDEGSGEGMLRKLEPEIGVITTGTFYRWLKSDKSGSPNRWEKWQLNMKANAFMLAEEALRIADDSEDAKHRLEHRRWLASRMDRDQFGSKTDTTVNVVSIGDEFLSALKRVEEKSSMQKEIVVEAEEEV